MESETPKRWDDLESGKPGSKLSYRRHNDDVCMMENWFEILLDDNWSFYVFNMLFASL